SRRLLRSDGAMRPDPVDPGLEPGLGATGELVPLQTPPPMVSAGPMTAGRGSLTCPQPRARRSYSRHQHHLLVQRAVPGFEAHAIEPDRTGPRARGLTRAGSLRVRPVTHVTVRPVSGIPVHGSRITFWPSACPAASKRTK